MATKPLEPRVVEPNDVRAGRPYVLRSKPLQTLVRRLVSVLALIALDVGGLAIGVYVAYVAKYLYEGDTILWGYVWNEAVLGQLPFLILVMVLTFWLAHLYAPREKRPGLGKVISSLAIVGLFAFVYVYGSPARDNYDTFLIFPTAVLTTALAIGLLRASYEVVSGEVLRLLGVRRHALLVGSGDALSRLVRGLGTGRGGIDYSFVGALANEAEHGDLKILGPPSALAEVLATTPVDEVILADDFNERELLEIVEAAHRRGVKVRVAPRTTELIVQQAEYVPGEGLPLFDLRPPTVIGMDWALKRTFDLTVSVLVLVLGLPLWVLVAVLVKLSSPGPIFYRDRRVGVAEREFGMLKFRTMYVDAAERQGELEASNEADGPLFKIKNDPRVTPVGRFLRRVSLDEIPQVLNVLKGDMSVVGPRPLPLRDYLQLEDWHRRRYLVLPGLTGLWQVSGRIDVSFDDLVRLDFYYIENWSLWLDIVIVAKTIPAIAAGRGAY